MLARWLTAPARPWASWAVDAFTAAYAVWTAVCHAVMLLGGSTHALVWAMTAVYVAGGFALAAWGYALYRRGALHLPGSIERADADPGDDADPGGWSLRTNGVLAVTGAVLLASWLPDADYLYKWIGLCAYLALAFGLGLRTKVPAPRQLLPTRWQQAAIWVLALACAWLALYVHRWRNDDCFYINMAVTLADLPHNALLSVSNIHAPEAGSALQPIFPPYRVHSFEALGGYLSFVTGVPAIEVIHVWLGGAAALMIPLALARLFQTLDERRWLPMLIAALCIYLFEGSSGLGYGNHGFVRSFTGKSVLLSVGVPILAHNGIAFARDPSLRRWLLLLAAQITAVGLSSTALWLAPVATMLAVMVPLSLERRAWKPFAAALLSCAYVLGLALWVRSQLLASAVASVDADDGGGGVAAASAWAPNFGLLYWWLKKMFAEIPVANHYLSLMVVAIAAARTGLLRRYLVLFCAALAFALMNPYLGDFVRFNVTGKWTGERVLFLLPVPAIVAAAFAAVLPARRAPLARAAGVLVMAIAVGVFFKTVPLRPVLTGSRDTTFHWPPGPKVPGAAYEIDERVTALQLGRAQVLAPEVVSWFLPTIHHHPYPVLANAKYLAASFTEKKKRKRLVELVSAFQYALSGKDRSALEQGLARYDVGAVVLTKPAKRTPGMLDVLKAAGFKRGKGNATYDLWVRKAP